MAGDYTTADWQLEAAADNLKAVYQLLVKGESENLAFNKTCTASSAENNPSWGWSLPFLVDGDRQNDNGHGEYAGFSSSSNTGSDHSEWVYVDLGAAMDVNRLVLYPSCKTVGGVMTAAGAPKAYEVQVSDDAETWTSVYSGKFDEPPAAGPQTAAFKTVKARYVRLYASSLSNAGGDYRLQLSEMEVYHLPVLPEQPEGLTYIELSAGALSPVFDYFTKSYTAQVGGEVEAVRVSPYATKGTAVTVNGDPNASGEASGSIPLQTGDNTITLTAGGHTYTIVVTRAQPVTPPIIKGDLTGDGKVNISDVMACCKILARKSSGQKPTKDEIARGDLTGEGEITITDVMKICKLLAQRA